ncbi:signal-regulatory protein beta-1-like [Clarias magur]|uniref:Signal-regulatory protein beta-1-like n=1 Tax=Clarias magur TaxID=1594786 RepID=A0A8J4T7E0_CLAMG|nr:signal-regulatory protein beta-1-like [Clarias magur]
MPQKVGEGLTYKEVKISAEFQTSGYKMEKTDNGISLTIPQVNKKHGGLYYCGQFNWENVAVQVSGGTFLSVTDGKDVKVSVFQSGVSDSVPAGASVTLQCSVLSESRAAELQVLWFRAAPPQSHPQIIYTHHNSSHQSLGMCAGLISANGETYEISERKNHKCTQAQSRSQNEHCHINTTLQSSRVSDIHTELFIKLIN